MEVDPNPREPAAPAAGVAVVALLALVAAAHAPALSGPFVLDDRLLVLENPRLGDLASVLGFFVEPVRAELPGGAPNLFYRPLSFLSLWVDSAIWGPDPFGFHLTNLLLHLASTVLLFRLARRWWGRPGALPFAIAGVWALLPVNVEPVAYIAARHDALCCALSLLALEVWTGGRGAWRLPVFAGLAVLAFLAKEPAATLPIAAALWDWLLGPCARGAERCRRCCRRRTLSAIATLALLAAIRVAAVGWPGAGGESTATPDAILVGSVAWHYVGVVASPFEYSIDRSRDVEVSTGAAALFVSGAAAAAILLGLIVRAGAAGDRRLVLFGALWSVLSYLAASNIVPLYTRCADRYLYLPTAGLVLAAAAGVAVASRRRAPLLERRGATAAAVGVPLLLLAVLSFWRSSLFADERRLYETSLRTSDSALLHNNYGLVLRRGGELEAAAAEFAAALRVSPEYHEARFNLAVLHREDGEHGEAEELLAAYVAARAEDPDGWLQWGLAALAREDLDEAVERLERADALRPRQLATVYHLAAALAGRGEDRRAGAVLGALTPEEQRHPRVQALLGRLRKSPDASAPGR